MNFREFIGQGQNKEPEEPPKKPEEPNSDEE